MSTLESDSSRTPNGYQMTGWQQGPDRLSVSLASESICNGMQILTMLGRVIDMAVVDHRRRAAVDHLHTSRELTPEGIFWRVHA